MKQWIIYLMFQHRLHNTAIIAHKILKLMDMMPIKNNSVYFAIKNISLKNCTVLLYLLFIIVLSAKLVSICDQFFETSRENKKILWHICSNWSNVILLVYVINPFYLCINVSCLAKLDSTIKSLVIYLPCCCSPLRISLSLSQYRGSVKILTVHFNSFYGYFSAN